jgi:hypothetical protein
MYGLQKEGDSRDLAVYGTQLMYGADYPHLLSGHEEEEEEINRLPWLGQSGRAAAGCACTAAVLRC